MMDNSPGEASPRKGELMESMFKSLNSYTIELQQELEILNRKLAEKIRLEQTNDTSHEQLQNDLIKLRAAIETNTVKRSILDRNLHERTALSQSLHSQILDKRQEQNKILDKANIAKGNHHRNIAKIAEQCANLTMAFRTNYHAYARADLNEIRMKTETRLKTISDEVTNAESISVEEKTKLLELNDKLHREMIHFNYWKNAIDLIGKKIQMDYEDLVQFDRFDRHLSEIENAIGELEAWHMRTGYPMADK